MRKFILTGLIVMTSCAHQKTESVRTAAPAKSAKVAKVQAAKAPMTDDAKQFAHDRSLILAKKNKNARGVVTANPQNKRLEMNLKPAAIKPTAETKLMEELRERFDQNDEIGFQSRYQAMQSQYPKSPMLSQAHYMAGLLSLSNKNYGRALKAFDLVMKNPRSLEAPQAMFAKAITYKRMNLREPSTGLLRQVQAQYPKSVEAQRAALEMKIDEQKAVR